MDLEPDQWINALCAHFDDARARSWARALAERAGDRVARHGRSSEWCAALASLPHIAASSCELGSRVRFGDERDAGRAEREALLRALHGLAPWRKGPFELFGVEIDAEWRSDWKWARVSGHIAPLEGRRVLDVGCGNGYYAWRMAGAGARLALGLDPSVLCVAQFRAVRRYAERHDVCVLPATDDDISPDLHAFDTVFSMGVLYHRRDPLAHLGRLRDALRPGGECVVETLVLAAGGVTAIFPAGRYAKMRNVHAIPSVTTALGWMGRAGFANARCVDVTPTTVAEQRSTPWMRSQSLADFLDPEDSTRTVEGHPAPVRGIFVASAP